MTQSLHEILLSREFKIRWVVGSSSVDKITKEYLPSGSKQVAVIPARDVPEACTSVGIRLSPQMLENSYAIYVR